MTSLTIEQPINSTTLLEIQTCCQVLDDKKAINLSILDVREKSTITDYFVVATGSSQPHLRAMRDALVKTFKEKKISVIGVDAVPDSGWVVLDMFDFMIHLFNTEKRDFYSLESLWKDAKILDPESFLAE